MKEQDNTSRTAPTRRRSTARPFSNENKEAGIARELERAIAENARLRTALEAILSETKLPFQGTQDGPMRREGRIMAIAATSLRGMEDQRHG